MTMLLDPQSSALVTLSPSGKLVKEAMAIAGASEVLCCTAHPDGAAYNGATPNVRHFVMHGGSAFHGSELDLVLRSNFIRHVAFTGDTIGRLLHDAEEARLRGYDAAIVVEAADVARATALSAELFGAKTPVACCASKTSCGNGRRQAARRAPGARATRTRDCLRRSKSGWIPGIRPTSSLTSRTTFAASSARRPRPSR